MRVLQSLPAFLTVLAARSISATEDPTPSTPPRFERLFYGLLELGGQPDTLDATFGTRFNIPVKGLNLTDTSGNVAATLVSPTADTGVLSNFGIFFPHATVVIRWTVDNKLAYLALNGVGKLFDFDMSYVHLETDSEVYSELNGRFLVANVSFPVAGGRSNILAPTLTLFGAV